MDGVFRVAESAFGWSDLRTCKGVRMTLEAARNAVRLSDVTGLAGGSGLANHSQILRTS
jgi:hypothetical protein